jgi:type VI secretion system protein ImpH
MASEHRTTPDRLAWLAEVEREPWAFDFHLVLRRIESIFRDKPRLGEALRPSDEPVRCGQPPSTAFAPSAVTSFTSPRDGEPGRLGVSFFGMFGPRGPLPVHITEYARDRLRNAADGTLVAFIDLFHHRMLLLFHRAWAVAQPTASHDRQDRNRFTTYLGSLFGLALRATLGRDVIPDSAKLQYSGRLAALTRNAEGLCAVLSDYFDLPIEVEEFIGEWVELPEGGRWLLGHSREKSTLGRSAILGARVWQCAHKFRLVIGPVTRRDFQRMLPGGPSLTRMAALVRAYVGDELKWDVRLVLAPDASVQLQLGREGKLGWNARLGAGTAGEREPDVIVDPFSHETQRTLAGVAA